MGYGWIWLSLYSVRINGYCWDIYYEWDINGIFEKGW